MFVSTVHDATIRDGVTYAMVAYDNDAQQPVFKHEPAWDGEVGLIAKHRTDAIKHTVGCRTPLHIGMWSWCPQPLIVGRDDS